MAKSDDKSTSPASTTPETGGTGGGSPPSAAPSEDQRVNEKRELALREQAATAVGDANAAKARVAALEGELAKKDEELATLRKANEALEGRVAGLAVAVNRSGLPVLPVKLPESARQLRESVTIAAGLAGKKTRTTAKAGDVVMFDPSERALEKLQRELGVAATVHPIGPEQARDLEESGFLA